MLCFYTYSLPPVVVVYCNHNIIHSYRYSNYLCLATIHNYTNYISLVVAEGTVEETENQGDEKGEGEGGEEGKGGEEGGEVEGGLQLEEDEIDLRRYRPAGGPIVMTILELPPPPKTVGQWTIRRGQSVDMYIHTVYGTCTCTYSVWDVWISIFTVYFILFPVFHRFMCIYMVASVPGLPHSVCVLIMCMWPTFKASFECWPHAHN